MQLSLERVICCLEDGVSILHAKDDDFTQLEVVIVNKDEWLYWADLLEQENVAQGERSHENFMLAA